MDDFEIELKKGFLDEAAQLLSDTEQCFLDLETKSDSDPSLLEKIFRLAHNLKGSARAVGFAEMGEFTHQLESLLLKLKNREMAINSSIVSLLLQCNDHLREWVEKLKVNVEEKVDSQTLLNDIQNILSGNVEVEKLVVAEVPAAEAFSDTPEVVFTGEVEVQNVESPKQEISVSVASSVSQTVQSSIPENKASDLSKTNKKTESSGNATDESIRVSSVRLEKLMNNVGELVILQTVLNQQKYQIASPFLQKTIGQLAKITKDIQEISMGLRMVPLKQTFQKMQRIVRDTSKALSKDINLIITGEETELDKTVVEHLGDPLVHLIRNACDHGIENSDERISAGKDPKGNVFLSAYHQGGKIVIEIREDGRGLDAEKLKSIAVKKGLIKEDVQLTKDQAHNLIFAPGFSTKAQVTEISGRGVGMDVVKTNIEKVLQGEVLLETQLGKGTTFKIMLPLTLAIIDGMVVQVGPERFIIPLNHVHESIRPKDQDVHYVTGLGEVLKLRGESLPLYRLSNLLARNTKYVPPGETIAIIVRTSDKPFAVCVDDILGQQQVVIKRLGSEIQNLKGVTGGAILGDGKAALILDLDELSSKHKMTNNKNPTLKGVA